MPNWSTDIPDEPRGHGLPIKRTPAYKPLHAIVTSTDLIGCYTHFYKGSTTPCSRPDCEPCLNGIPYRWHAYMSAVDVGTNLHFIFEVTALSAEFFVAYRERHLTLRGCQFQAKRWNNKPNGRILIQTKPADLGERQLPPVPDLKKCMAIIWSLPLPTVTTPDRDPERNMPHVHTDPDWKPKT